MPEDLGAYAGLFLGCLARALLPYLRRAREEAEQGKELKWEHRYTLSLVFALAVSLVAATLLLPSLQVPPGARGGILPAAFAAGWGAHDLLNQVMAS